MGSFNSTPHAAVWTLLTWLMNYSSFTAHVAIGVCLLADRPMGNLGAALTCLIYFFGFIDLLGLLDVISILVFPVHMISKHKVLHFSWEMLYWHTSTKLFSMGAGAFLCYLGLMTFPWRADPWNVILQSYIAACCCLIIRDMIGILGFHKWMHENAYHLQAAPHHQAQCDDL